MPRKRKKRQLPNYLPRYLCNYLPTYSYLIKDQQVSQAVPCSMLHYHRLLAWPFCSGCMAWIRSVVSSMLSLLSWILDPGICLLCMCCTYVCVYGCVQDSASQICASGTCLIIGPMGSTCISYNIPCIPRL